ncbi:MAG: HAD family phosphatase [Anaerolineales bacterium]|nr:HAD family phosphatase [Anaerolineales bacterium]
MTQELTAAIFDFGNVLLGWDVRRLYLPLLSDAQAVERFLEETRFMEWNAQQDAGRSFKEGVADLSQKFPHYADLIRAYDTHWEESLTDVDVESVNILREMKEANWTLYLLSNFSAEKFSLIRERYDFLDLFDDLIISGEHKTVKPGRAIFEITLRRIQRRAEECLFIDDSLANVEAARTMGFHAVHFQTSAQLREDLRKLSIRGIAL